ncbi:MAG: YggS family pyridoxal phosphate-dependent enzyme [Bacteroidaceae bacterium]|nr:YggS family pyridoxal phosphate-dependent enzyme [Bacteroidaceae bacterium]
MIADQIARITSELPANCRLVAVSKFHPAEALMEAYSAGQRIFGESHVQELQAKHEALPSDIEWHFIGHLQTNKVKYIAPYVSLIHAVDTPKLLQEIEKQGAKVGRRISCLLELHVAEEESKYGFSPEECLEYLASGEWRQLAHVQIAGLMCMATNTDDESRIDRDFELARHTFDEARNRFFPDDPAFCELSMGMSHDYKLALRHGATLVRIGTTIFGERVY